MGAQGRRRAGSAYSASRSTCQWFAEQEAREPLPCGDHGALKVAHGDRRGRSAAPARLLRVAVTDAATVRRRNGAKQLWRLAGGQGAQRVLRMGLRQVAPGRSAARGGATAVAPGGTSGAAAARVSPQARQRAQRLGACRAQAVGVVCVQRAPQGRAGGNAS